MVRSLRWRLQIWHAVILSLVVAGFGTLLDVTVRKARMDEIDAELLAAARVLEGSLRAFPRAILEGRPLPPPDMPPPWEERRPGLPLPPRQLLRMLALPHSIESRHENVEIEPYFVIWLANASILKASPHAEGVPPPGPLPADVRRDEQYRVRPRGELREVILLGPDRSQILVGRSIEKELADLARLRWQLVLSGCGVLVFGLFGGWWVLRRIVRPIEVMSDTAAAISASNLTRRIETADADDELARLGQVLNAMFDRLQAAFEQQVRFTADASHELRTPLAIILSHAELALTRPRSTAEYRESLETCVRASHRMKAMVEDLLTLARADAGKLELRAAPVDLHDVAQECIALLAPQAGQRNVRLELTGDSVFVAADADRLAQVITNLANNAIAYNRPKGTVTVETGSEGEYAMLTVTDTGIGIAAEDLPHVFDRFFRVDPARSRELGGSGLGLAICKSIVEAHGGMIGVASEVDRGTCVTMRLPRAMQPAESVRSILGKSQAMNEFGRL